MKVDFDFRPQAIAFRNNPNKHTEEAPLKVPAFIYLLILLATVFLCVLVARNYDYLEQLIKL